MTRLFTYVLVVVSVLAAGCSSADPTAAETTTMQTTAVVETTTTTAATTTTTVPPETTTSAPTTTTLSAERAAKLVIAETLLDALYAFDTETASAMTTGPARVRAVYMTGWMEGANYRIITRKPCTMPASTTDEIVCAVVVADDMVGAVAEEPQVTDTWHIRIEDDIVNSLQILSAGTPTAHSDGVAWLLETRPELFAGVCKGYYNDGDDPKGCAEAVVAGLKEYAELNNLP